MQGKSKRVTDDEARAIWGEHVQRGCAMVAAALEQADMRAGSFRVSDDDGRTCSVFAFIDEPEVVEAIDRLVAAHLGERLGGARAQRAEG